MPLTDAMQLVSVDDHIIEHRDVWTSRLPARYRDDGPRTIESEVTISEGGIDKTVSAEVWVYQGQQYFASMLFAAAGKSYEEFSTAPYRFEDIRPGCYDPVARINDMEQDGVQAQLCFPTFPRFAGTRFLEGNNRELALLCVQAYNDFIIDEWCSSAPDRYIPMAILPLWDTSLAVSEIERTALKGIKAISFPENPVPLKLPSWHTHHWDNVFAAAQDANLPLCMHFGTAGHSPSPGPDSPFAVTTALMGLNSMSALIDLLFSPVFYRFPQLKVALSEGGIGWIPYSLEHADSTWDHHRFYSLSDDQTIRPSTLFRDHIWGCFITDEVGVANRDRIGVCQVMWESDYPHSDSVWPNSRQSLKKGLSGIPDAEAHAIVELNARELFNFPRT